MTDNLDYSWTEEKHHTPNIVDTLSKILNKKEYKKMKHLDVGCGNGALTSKIYNYFESSLGIDLSDKGIHFAKKYENEKLKFQHTGMKDLINKNIKYDFISSIEVIEHQYDPLQYIKEINEVTNKNGLILISTPFHGYFKNLLISILNLNDKHYGVLWKHGHIKFFSVKSLKKLIEVSNCPIKIEDIKFSGRIYPFSNSMIFLLRKY